MLARLLLVILCVASPAWAASWKEGTVSRPGIELHYRERGSGTPILLLAGGPGFSSRYLEPVADSLASGWRAVLFDQRGTGASLAALADSADMTLPNCIEDLEAVREALGQDRLIVLGHSYGGMLAMAWATEHPEHVRALVLLGSGGPDFEFASWFNDNIAMRLRPEDRELGKKWRDSTLVAADPDQAALERFKAKVPGYFFDHDAGVAARSMFAPGDYHLWVNAVLFDHMQRDGFDLKPALARCTAPVLVLQGRQDPVGELTAMSIQSAMPGAKVTFLERCGHLPWIEKPAEMYAALREFLNGVSG